jgi:hypothetical protein
MSHTEFVKETPSARRAKHPTNQTSDDAGGAVTGKYCSDDVSIGALTLAMGCHGRNIGFFFSAKSPWDKTIQKRDFCIAKKFLQSIPTSHLSYLSYQYLSYVYVILPVDPLFGKPHVSCVIPRHPSILRPARQIQCVKLRKIHNFSFAQVEDVRGLGSM